MDSSSSSSGRDDQNSQQSGPEPVSRPAPLRLTEEEKAVLLECRRKSLARGLPLGVVSVVALRWFITQGRVPRHVQRWSWFYYSGAFLGSFLMGVSSYRRTCFDKLMALDNSVLADQVRKHMDQIRTQGFDGYKEGCSSKETPKSPPHHHHSSPYQRQQEQRTYPAPGQYHHSSLRSPSPESDKPSSLIADAYKQDKAALEAKEEPVEQPDAFESSFGSSTSQSYDVDNWQDKHSAPPSRSRGRTFDEIREENRRRQLQQNFPRTPSSSSGTAGEQRRSGEDRDWRQGRNQERQQGSGGIKRRNKYGDEIYEEKSR